MHPSSPLADPRLTATAALVIRLATLANRAFFAAVALAILLSFVFVAPLTAYLATTLHPADPHHALTGLRLLLLIGLAMAVATDRLLAPLARIIATARAGDPFIPANAARLQTIGWCLLALQLLDIPGILLAHSFPDLGTAAPDGGISVGGWVAVLLVFILARIFAAGTALRDDLAGTV